MDELRNHLPSLIVNRSIFLVVYPAQGCFGIKVRLSHEQYKTVFDNV